MVEDAVMMCADLESLTHPGFVVLFVPPPGVPHVGIHEVRAPVDELGLLAPTVAEGTALGSSTVL